MSHLLQAALAEERQLLERLEAVRAVIRAYGGEPSSDAIAGVTHAPHVQRDRPVRAPSETTLKIKTLLIDRLRSETSPTPTRVLLAFLQNQGVKVGGKNPIGTLSALLSHAEEFKPVGRIGWLLKSRTPDAGTSGVASAGGAPTPPIESQERTTG